MFRALWIALLVSVVVLTTGAGAARADDEVGLSLDGQQWSSELRQPLFDPDFRWVPGDTETRSVWVRNQGPTRATMEIGLKALDSNPLLADDDLRIDARVHDGAWLPLGSDGTAQTLVDGSLAKGDEVRVDLRVAFVPESTNPTQQRRLPLKFVIRLTQAGPGDGSGGSDGPGGGLPDTGNTVEPWLFWLAGGLIATGLVLVARRRKEEETDG